MRYPPQEGVAARRYPVRGPGSLDSLSAPTGLAALPPLEAGNPHQTLPRMTCGPGVMPPALRSVVGGLPGRQGESSPYPVHSRFTLPMPVEHFLHRFRASYFPCAAAWWR